MVYRQTLNSYADTPIYRLFEHGIVNDNHYDNTFLDLALNVQYQASSGKLRDIYGFYDGDGKGKADGTMWEMRFIPHEIGAWKYVYSWSDETQGGGKGILNTNFANSQ